MRKKIVAGNWKMNNDLAETEVLLKDLKKQIFPEDIQVMIAPSFTNLYAAFESVREHPIEVIAQNMHEANSGAYTGEISAPMLLSIGVQTVILGHSERRAIFGETNSLLAKKINAALDCNMRVIYCVGEELKDRNKDKQYEVVKAQIDEALFHLTSDQWKSIIIAYEPVWAIGTGETATSHQAQQMHSFIRKTIQDKYSDRVSNNVEILYGGSVKPDNAKEIFGQTDVDGGLIGGASLSAESFMAIINSFK